jgi:hypothetical protein
MAASANVAVAINPERVRQRIAGVSLSEAQAILERDWLLASGRPPEIKLWPPMLSRLPLLPIRITVTVIE